MDTSHDAIEVVTGVRTKPLDRKVDEVADDIRTRRAIENLAVLRGHTETRHKAKSWDRERRTVTRIEATMLGLGIFVVTSLDVGSAEHSSQGGRKKESLTADRHPARRLGCRNIWPRDRYCLCSRSVAPATSAPR